MPMQGSYANGAPAQLADLAAWTRGATTVRLTVQNVLDGARLMSAFAVAENGTIGVQRSGDGAIISGLYGDRSGSGASTVGKWIISGGGAPLAKVVVNGIEVVTLSATGIGLNTGALSFPPTQNPSSDPNTFDDYEEGTYTPVVSAGSGAIGSTAGVAGWYLKQGQGVTAMAEAQITNVGSGTGSLGYTVPFACSSAGGSVGATREVAVNGSMGAAQIDAGNAGMLCFKYDTTTLINTNWKTRAVITYRASA